MTKKVQLTKLIEGDSPQFVANEVFAAIRLHTERNGLECDFCTYYTYINPCTKLITYHAFLVFVNIQEK